MLYIQAYKQLSKLEGVECILHDMPDPYICREDVWIPHIRDDMKLDDTSVIIGHSSGATAAMRYAEKYQVRAIILVSAYTTDLGDENERASGYFSRPWEWEKMKINCKNIIQFGSTDDPFLPWWTQNEVAENTKADLKKYTERGHFMTSTFPELINVVKGCLKAWTLCQRHDCSYCKMDFVSVHFLLQCFSPVPTERVGFDLLLECFIVHLCWSKLHVVKCSCPVNQKLFLFHGHMKLIYS